MTFTIRPGLVAGARPLSRLGDDAQSVAYDRFEVRPAGPTIGAEICGVDIGAPVDDELFAQLDRALLEWKVLWFRDQDITGGQHRDFARRWGELEVHPFLPAGEVPEVVRFDKGLKESGYENIWHSDVSWRLEPSLGSVLRCITPAQRGGDTLWADMYMAYQCLDDETKERIEDFRAVHDFTASFGLGMGADKLAEMRSSIRPPSIPSCAPTLEPVEGFCTSTRSSPPMLSDSRRARARHSSPISRPRPGYPSTSAASGGRPTPSPFGTTDARSTTPCRTTRHSAASWSGPPSSAIDRVERFPAGSEQEPVALLRRAS